MARVGARPGDWKTQPMPEATVTLPFERRFSAAEFERLRRGLVPEAMEDKWFIVWHDEALWMHRSWSGLCVYCLKFAAAAECDGVVVASAIANRDPSQYGTTVEHDVSTLGYLIDTFLQFAARR